MKILKTASGNKLKLSKKEWESIGKKAEWMKTAVAPGAVSGARFDALLNELAGLQSELKTAPSNYQAIAIIYNGIIEATAKIQEDLNAQLNTMQSAMNDAGERVDLRSGQSEPA